MYRCNMYVAAHVTPVLVTIIMPGPVPCKRKAHGTRVTCMWEHI